MRFERIFEDLEGRFAHHEQEEMRAVSEDLTRAERAQLTLVDRLRGNVGREVTVHLGADLRLTGTIDDAGPEWLALHETGASARAIIPLDAIALVRGLSARVRPAPQSPVPGPGLGSMLRSVARDRTVVRVETTAGRITGRLATVGADTVDIQALPTGENAAAPGTSRLTLVTASLLAVVPT